jgi:hypothetical protein
MYSTRRHMEMNHTFLVSHFRTGSMLSDASRKVNCYSLFGGCEIQLSGGSVVTVEPLSRPDTGVPARYVVR